MNARDESSLLGVHQKVDDAPGIECRGCGCSDCLWFGTEEARFSHIRAREIVARFRGTDAQTA
ncbi:MAG: hypothetical protein CMO80_24730 [Verrucomicrobiales bacterium]|nr:hypothetical protein [Verrucomicrobiales bacterium]